MNYKQLYAKKKALALKVLRVFSGLTHDTGIYIFRRDKGNFEYSVYVGQAVDGIKRAVSHLEGYESHIDKSLRKHKFKEDGYEDGWYLLDWIICDKSSLDVLERNYISIYQNVEGVELLNVTNGGQNAGKKDINARNNEKLKRYSNGKNFGYLKAQNEIKQMFKYLKVEKLKENKTCQKYYDKFMEFLGGTENGDNQT